MHIVFVSPHSDPQANLGEPDSGGQCVYEHQLALALSRIEGVKVSIFCRQTGKRPAISKLNDNYSIYRIETSKPEFIPKEIIEREMPEFVMNMHKQLKKLDTVDVIHGHYWDGAKAALMYKYNFEDLPFVWTPHSLGTVKRQKFPGKIHELQYNFLPRMIWENYGIYAADAVVVSTQDERQKVLDDYSVVGNPTTVISPGIDITGFSGGDKQQLRKKLHLPSDDLLMLCLGRMSRSKGYHHAVRVLSHLLHDQQVNAKLLIIGGSVDKSGLEERSYFDEIQQLVTSLQLEEHVIMMPAVEHERVGEYFSSADCFMMTSENEPFGLTTIEAMASKTAVIAHNRGGTKDIISHGDTGILVNMHDYQTVAAQIAQLHKTDQLLDLATAAQKEVIKQFSWDERGQRFMEIYTHILKKKRQPSPLLSSNHFFIQTNLEVPNGLLH